MGTAFAVLAIYVLTLLLPLHQAAALQRDLGKLGYETAGMWSVCASLTQDERGNSQTPTAVKCPATGVGKNDFAADIPASFDLDRRASISAVAYAFADEAILPPALAHNAQARAPPAKV